MPFTTTGGKCARCFDQHKCPYCPEQTFYNSLTLIEHLKNTSDHCDAEEAIFSCSICNNKSFSSKTAYIHHLQQKQIHKYDLHQAACCGKYEDVDRLTRLENMNITGTSHKVNPNSQISSHVGSTPMHCAAYNGYSRCLKVMLSWPECNPNVPDEIDGRTPVHVAAERGKETCLKLLLKKGGKLDLKDKNGDTPIKLVSSFRCVVVIVHYLRHCIKQGNYFRKILIAFVQLLCFV